MWIQHAKRPGVLAAVGLAAILGIPLTRWWWSEHGRHPYERLEREKRAEERIMAELPGFARADLGCETAEIEGRSPEIWVVGCGRRARYVYEAERWRRVGDVATDDKRPLELSGCRVRWRRGDEGAASLAAGAALAVKRPVRVGVPPEALGFTSLAKLRFGDAVEVSLEGPPLDALAAPCMVDGREARCAVPWEAVVEVADCGEGT